MFYSQFILAKKGPLGTIWIAAHLERKLRKNQVADTDIGVSVDSILFPEMPIALRLSSHLLLGVVRIYSRKVNYLFDDCSEALLKVKQAFRSTAVDLPPEESTAPYHSITLPETFDLDDFELPDNELYQSNYVDQHISSKEQITLQDTMEGVVYSTSKFGLDERFGDGDASGLDLDEELLVEKAATAEFAAGTSNSDVDPQASVQANESYKYEDNQEVVTAPEAMPASGIAIQHLEEYDGDNEPVDYAQAPCTPGVWEEPNLSNIQETSACDDHHEPENHSITEFAVKENLENVSSKEDECSQEQRHNQFESHIVATEQMMGDLGSTPFTESFIPDHVMSKSPVAEVSESVIPVSDDPVKVEDLLNKIGRGEDPAVQAVDDNHEMGVEHQGNQEKAFHLVTELESNSKLSEKDQNHTFLELNNSTISVCSPHGSTPSSDFPSIRPCVTIQNHESSGNKLAGSVHPSDFTSMHSYETYGKEEHPSAYGDSILVQGEVPHATEALERNFLETRLVELGSNDEVQVVSSISNRLVGNSFEGEAQVDNINSYTSEFPAPEKLLSFPQGLSDVPKNLVPESTPAEKDVATVEAGHARSNMLSGKKRSFTESSLTAQSLNLNEASGLLNTNMTGESFMDDDLLSSILVGRRSSIFKMNPTPPIEVPSTKRRRSAPKTSSISKRKVLMDDNMVLHGDTIRQQLTNTEDIRRLRKKAPCTRSEISVLEKQFWEDELFSEAIFTGSSIKIASLHNQSYDPSKVKIVVSNSDREGGADPKLISQNDGKGMQLEVETENMVVAGDTNVLKENEGKDSFTPVTEKDVSEAEPTEFPLVTANHSCDNNAAALDYHESRIQMHAIRDDAAEPFSSEHEILQQGAETDIVAKTFSDADTGFSVIPVEVESLAHANVVVSDTFDLSALPAVPGEAEMTSQMDAPGVTSNENMDLPAVDMDIRSSEPIESNMVSEIKIDDASITEIPEEKCELVADVSATFSSEVDVLKSHVGTFDQGVEIRNNGICGEEFVSAATNDAEVNPVWEDDPLGDRENPGHQVTFQTTAVDAEDVTAKNQSDDEEFTYSAVGNDTDFLNFDDDDDENEAAGDYMPEAGATRAIDNSGWSSRTKAVAKYLQIMFDKEGERGRTMLPVNNLLVGKTRKEASRMFFETLVLKTKDYIHVEQAEPYENINVFPRAKLLKAEFQ